ncbi:MAG: alpha/beta hydrolase [Myxococcota bacterium]
MSCYCFFMWGAAIGLVAGRIGPSLAQNIFGLRPDAPERLPLPSPWPGVVRVDRGLRYGDHPRQRFDLLRPPSSQRGPYPGVVLFHGGGFARGHRNHVSGIGRALASRGFTVLSAGYRLLPQHDIGEIVADALSMTKHAYNGASDFELDPARLATMGRSAGGHLALMAAYTADVPVRAAISEAGPTDFDPIMWDGSVRGAVMQRFSKHADVRGVSPVHMATMHAPPTLLLHGCRDQNVPFAHSRILQVRLDTLGVPVQLLALPRTGHNPIRWRWRVTMAAVYHWLEQHLQRADAKHDAAASVARPTLVGDADSRISG